MGYKIQGNNDELLQYTAKKPAPLNIIEVKENSYEASQKDDIILVNPTSNGATEIKLFNPVNDGYLEDDQLFEGMVRVTDKKGDAGTNNITVKDYDGNTLYVINANNISAFFELQKGEWVYIGHLNY